MRETGSIAREDAVGKIGQYRRGVFLCEANRERRERERRAQLQAKMQEAEEGVFLRTQEIGRAHV